MSTATIDTAETLPRWDLDSIFPGPESPEFREAAGSAGLAIAELTTLFDHHGVGTRPMGAIDTNVIANFDEVITRYDATLEDAMRLEGYLGCLTAADVRDEAAQAAASEWRETLVDLARLAPRFIAWVSTIRHRCHRRWLPHRSRTRVDLAPAAARRRAPDGSR